MPFDEAMRFEALRAIKPPMALVLKMTYNSRHVSIGNFENLRRKKASLLLELRADQTSEGGGSIDAMLVKVKVVVVVVAEAVAVMVVMVVVAAAASIAMQHDL
ncbi:hypothetical protein V1478_004676 [Vespula squamosa]|uniref:Uncharacterized protein n=1 Tax=Vespula squamosa TaxID=30214 RepID=A0ABD2BHS8_VESSQ